MLNRIIIRVLLLFLGVGSIFAQGKLETESEAVTETLKSYAAAVESKNMQEIEKHVATSEDFTMFEGGHINWGWQDYRDHHLAPELKAFLEFHYNFEDIRAHVMGDMAFATLKYNLAIKMKEREVDGEGLATVILRKQEDQWRIMHMHTSRIPKREH